MNRSLPDGKTVTVYTYNTYSIELDKQTKYSYLYYTMPSELASEAANERLYCCNFNFSVFGSNNPNMHMYLTAWLPTRITIGRWEYQDGYSYYNDSKNNVLIYKTVG